MKEANTVSFSSSFFPPQIWHSVRSLFWKIKQDKLVGIYFTINYSSNRLIKLIAYFGLMRIRSNYCDYYLFIFIFYLFAGLWETWVVVLHNRIGKTLKHMKMFVENSHRVFVVKLTFFSKLIQINKTSLVN